MTTCVAGICDGGKAIVLAADRMVGLSYVQGEVGKKILAINDQWFLLISGNDVSPVYTIVEHVKNAISGAASVTCTAMRTAFIRAYQSVRNDIAEMLYLAPRGLTFKDYLDKGKDTLPETDFRFIGNKLGDFHLDINLLLVGFDEAGEARIFTLDGEGHGNISEYKGFMAIGSGAINAILMLNYRTLTPGANIRDALYYVVEAKYYGEMAAGVGEATDVLILRNGQPTIELTEVEIEGILFQKIILPNRPRELTKSQINLLNGLSSLSGFKMSQPPPQRQNRRGSAPHDQNRPD